MVDGFLGGKRFTGICAAWQSHGPALGCVARNTLSALVGISCFHLVSEPLLALPLAAAFSILGMFILRCLHPPAAAVALIVVLGEIGRYRYAFFPVMVDSILLILAGAVYSNLSGKPYPNKPPS